LQTIQSFQKRICRRLSAKFRIFHGRLNAVKQLIEKIYRGISARGKVEQEKCGPSPIAYIADIYGNQLKAKLEGSRQERSK
jgi:hypothetical protein